MLLTMVNMIMAQSVVTNGSDKPWWLADTFPCPVFFKVVLLGLETATRDEDDDPNDAIENCIYENAPAKMSVMAKEICECRLLTR